MNPGNGRQAAVQVKTSVYGQYHIGKFEELGQVFVFVHINKDLSADYYVVPAEDVARLSGDEHDRYLKSHPAARKDQPPMLGLPSIGSFEDKWEFLGLD